MEKKEEIAFYYQTYFRRMVLLANEYVHDQDVAQDLSQDVFVHLFQKKHEEHIQNHKAYFFTAIRNRCLDFLKTKKVRASHHEAISNLSSEAYFEQAVEHAELEDFIMKTISELPKQQEYIFKESRMHGKTNGEIAKEMGLSKRTIETQISNALKTLRSKLGQFETFIFWFF